MLFIHSTFRKHWLHLSDNLKYILSSVSSYDFIKVNINRFNESNTTSFNSIPFQVATKFILYTPNCILKDNTGFKVLIIIFHQNYLPKSILKVAN